MSRDIRDVSPVTGILMGGLFLVAGLSIIFVALDWIHVDPASIHAPRWVLGLCGGMFALPGLGFLYYGIINGLGRGARERAGGDDRFQIIPWLMGLVIAGGMTVVASWIAFGPGERAFSGSVGVGGVEVGGSGRTETFGRWVFGIGAVMTGLFTIWGLIYGLRKLMGADRSGPRGPRAG